MVMKFRGDFGQLRDHLRGHDICGSWERQPNGVFMLRCPGGANLHWAAGNKSLWCDGKEPARGKLVRLLAAVVSEYALAEERYAMAH